MNSNFLVDSNNDSPVTFERKDINSLVLEYLILEGYYEAACQFSKDTGIPFSAESYHINERLRIIEMVMHNEIEECILQINSSWPEFFDQNPEIYFQLRQLKMLEYIRSRQLMEALKFAQVYFADAVCKVSDKSCKMLTELQKTMTLLAFDNPVESPNGYLLKRDFTRIVAGNLNLAVMRHITGGGSVGDCCSMPTLSAVSGQGVSGAGGETVLTEARRSSPFSVDPIPKLTQMMALMMQLKTQAHCKIDFPDDFFEDDDEQQQQSSEIQQQEQQTTSTQSS